MASHKMIPRHRFAYATEELRLFADYEIGTTGCLLKCSGFQSSERQHINILEIWTTTTAKLDGIEFIDTPVLHK